MKKFDYKNKIAIVTGASSGIGREIATLLVKKYGCTVYGIGRSLKRLDVVREELGPEKFLCCSMDVSVRHSWEKFASFLENTHTSPGILINCAGVLPKFAGVDSTSIDEIESTLGVNYLSSVYACKYIMPYMEKGGVVANISSASALCPFAGVSAYSASKAALARFTEALSCESKDTSVSLVMPGFVKTDIMKKQTASEKEMGLIGKVSADPVKTARKILKRVQRRKRRTVLGFDGHFMSIMYRLFPPLAPKFFTRIIKKSNLELFKDI